MSFIHIVADYGPGDLAFSEIIGSLAGRLENSRYATTSIPSFNTVATGFAVAQLGSDPHLADVGVLFANCAPRHDNLEERSDNEGEGLLLALTKFRIPLVVVNSGYSLSFIKSEIEELWSLDVGAAGSQFRSRDIFPGVVARVANKDDTVKVKLLDVSKAVPDPPKRRIGYVDSFGNLKTTLRSGDEFLEQLEPGQRLGVRINGIRRTVRVAGGSFQVQEGDIAFSPGSSGRDRPFWEIFQRSGSAWQSFGEPLPGAPLEFRPH
jgi:hypothetical protein